MDSSLKPDSSSVPSHELPEEWEEALPLLACFLYLGGNSAHVIRHARETVIARKKARMPSADRSAAVGCTTG
jgi:hypothetical protein